MLNQDLLHVLNQRVRYFQKHLNDRLKKHDLYHAQWSILYYLNKNGSKTQSEITNYFHVEAPTITRTVKRMEENGWVKRVHGADKRERFIELTEYAKSKYAEILTTVSEHEDVILANLSEEEKKLLLTLLQKLN
ncbi:MarR family winged helix-turn-helix transcriptional regulator [Ornithinibacillus xuwenensis]|uniref:MarR family transcriptional regulator n=1 Tax=Ornithinibacillus xuwenensis TaxID=3144668 RepID=A0ABU9XGS1_9BACI